jgi:uncharacterized protein involved in exopolysaccharide biosynthesis
MSSVIEHEATNNPNHRAPDSLVLTGAGPPQPDRLLIIWRRKWWILLLAILLCGATFVVASHRPATYTARATIQVTLVQTAGIGEQNALAANELAAQYAQLARSQPVLSAAAKRLGKNASGLSSAVTAAPVNNYNVIGITVGSSSPTRSADQANAVAESLVHYLDSLRARAIARINQTESTRLKTLDSQIALLEKDIAKQNKLAAGSGAAATIAAATATSDRALLGSLSSERADLFTAPARSLATAQPTLTVTDRPQLGVQQSDHAYLYSALALAVGLLLFAELFLMAGLLRARLLAGTLTRHQSG